MRPFEDLMNSPESRRRWLLPRSWHKKQEYAVLSIRALAKHYDGNPVLHHNATNCSWRRILQPGGVQFFSEL